MDKRKAKKRIKELKSMLNRLSKIQEPDGVWDWWLKNEIAELETVVKKASKFSWVVRYGKSA